MRFPTAKKVDDLSFFPGMQMATVPGASFKVEIWNPNAGAKGSLEITWFRIFGISMELGTEKKASFVASCVGLPLEVDQINVKRGDFARVKIGCRDIRKVPAVVECLLDLLTPDFGMCQGRVLQRRKSSTSYDRWIWRGGRVPQLKILLTEEEEIDQIFWLRFGKSYLILE